MPSLPFPLSGALGDDGGGSGGGGPPAPVGHVAIALSKLAEQYKASPNLTTALSTFAKQTQALDDAAVQLDTLADIDASEGVQLDTIGDVVGETRQGFDDVAYRLHLKARVILNKGSGTIEDVLRLFRQLMGPGCTLTLQEEYPAALVLTLGGIAVDATLAPYLVLFLAAGGGGGVKRILHWSEHAEADSFAFAGAPGKGFDAGYFTSARYA